MMSFLKLAHLKAKQKGSCQKHYRSIFRDRKNLVHLSVRETFGHTLKHHRQHSLEPNNNYSKLICLKQNHE